MDIERIYSHFLKNPVVTTDSRNIPLNSIFFALRGEHFNGNEFAAPALEKGAAIAVIDDPSCEKDDRFILVPDTLSALQQLAYHHRRQMPARFLAITGSNGKTTTKELINAVLAQQFNTLATQGNLNNHIGVPLTLLRVTRETEFAIIEMGANHQGEIRDLCNIADPDYGIITNVGKAHLEGFGGFEGVKKAKGELYDYLKEKRGIIFINTIQPHLREMAGEYESLIRYGTDTENNCTGILLSSDPQVAVRWKKKNSGHTYTLTSQLIGAYNFDNILAAICIGDFFGVNPEKIKAGIENYSPSNNRSQIVKKGSNTIILDAYNANPSSMSVALKNFFSTPASARIAILGDMMELGEATDAEHRAIIGQLQNEPADRIVLIGDYFFRNREGLTCEAFRTTEEAGKWMSRQNFSNTLFLIKGSRKMGLEKLVEAINV